MPTPNPDNESREEWMERCVPVLINEGRNADQAVAICSSMWNTAKEEGELIDTDDIDWYNLDDLDIEIED